MYIQFSNILKVIGESCRDRIDKNFYEVFSIKFTQIILLY